MVSADLIAKMPSNLDFAAAAGVPLARLTALQTPRNELHVQAGDRVFPFEQIADAFEYLEQGHANPKVIVRMIDD